MQENEPWWREAVIYQIWPRSFMDSNGDGVGDLGGVISRLDYLNDGAGGGLGVDAIWLSPFFKSPLADYGYDVAGYTEVDPGYGDLATFDRLLEEAHRRRVRVLLDLVPNHTSDQHPWFLESRESVDSQKRDWYVWRDPAPGGGPPNNWMSAFPAAGSAWSFDEGSGQFYLHSYSANQPDLNWENPEVRAAMSDVMRFWLDRGVDGFRIDVVHRIAKDPQLGDNVESADDPEPLSGGRHDADWPTIYERLETLRAVADEYDDVLLVGEVYILDQERVVDYLGEGRLHLAHNFVFMAQPWTAEAMSSTVAEFESLVPSGSQGAWCLNNHDHSRVATRYGEHGQMKARAAIMVLLSLRGTPFLYQGEELGLADTEVPPDTVVDIDGRDGCRTPIPWEPIDVVGPGAGFSSARPWLPVGDPGPAASVQQVDSSSMLSHYRSLLSIRRMSAALRDGAFRTIAVEPNLWVYERFASSERVVVAVNFADESKPIGHVVCEGEIIASSSMNPTVGTLGPYEARWILPSTPQKSS